MSVTANQVVANIIKAVELQSWLWQPPVPDGHVTGGRGGGAADPHIERLRKEADFARALAADELSRFVAQEIQHAIETLTDRRIK